MVTVRQQFVADQEVDRHFLGIFKSNHFFNHSLTEETGGGAEEGLRPLNGAAHGTKELWGPFRLIK